MFTEHPLSTSARALAAAVVLAAAGTSVASSHREAPGITEYPKLDATDFYMFNSYEAGRADYVTIIANYVPFQTPYGGPNFFQLDPDGLYQLHIDNNADGQEDITFSFKFQTTLNDLKVNAGGQMVSVPLFNISGIGPNPGDRAFQTIQESFTLDVVRGDQYEGASTPVTNAADGASSFIKPADFVGNKSFVGDYEAYARRHIYTVNLPGSNLQGRVFVGQRKDPFVVNLGEVFDLVNTNPVGPANGKSDTLADDNVTSIIIEVPKAYLRSAMEPVIGGWTSASLPRTRIHAKSPGFLQNTRAAGPYVQVSRLSMPLVNEVVIGVPDKDRFNNSRPREDAQFATYVTNPSLPVLLNVLFGVTPPTTPRNDLVQVFLTGVPGLNKPSGAVQPSEMMRLNTSVAPTPRIRQKRLGVLAGDTAGFPNGRRPGDDVVDIELRVVMGALYPDAGVAGGNAPSGGLPYTDGAIVSARQFSNIFPYLRTPISNSPNTTPVGQ